MAHVEDLDRYSQLLLRLYRLAQALPIADFQDAALDLVKGVLPFDSSLWGTAAPSLGGPDIHTVHLHNKSPAMLPAYESVKQQDTAVATMFEQPRATRGFNLERWFSAPGQREIRDVMRRFEIENMLATTVVDPSTRFAHWILLYRADGAATYSAEEVARLELLAPHVMEALAINRRMHLERLGPEPYALPRGSAIADMRGVVYHADERFESLAGQEWADWHPGSAGAPRAGAGRGAKHEAPPMRRLPDALAAHFVQDKNERFRGRAVVVDARIEQQLLFLKARPRCRADGLTAREFTIAQLIAKGDTHKEIAQTLTRSPATVRNQIQVIYEKLGVGNIAGLIEELRLAD